MARQNGQNCDDKLGWHAQSVKQWAWRTLIEGTTPFAPGAQGRATRSYARG